MRKSRSRMIEANKNRYVSDSGSFRETSHVSTESFFGLQILSISPTDCRSSSSCLMVSHSWSAWHSQGEASGRLGRSQWFASRQSSSLLIFYTYLFYSYIVNNPRYHQWVDIYVCHFYRIESDWNFANDPLNMNKSIVTSKFFGVKGLDLCTTTRHWFPACLVQLEKEGITN